MGCAVEKAMPLTPIDPTFQTAGYAPLFGDEVVIENDAVTLAVSPRVGRIVWFGLRGGRNMLWVDPRIADAPHDEDRSTYFNHGGDKVWPMVQTAWDRFLPGGKDWPPDGVIDGQPWDVLEHTDRKIVMQSRYSEAFGVRVRREIVLLEHTKTTPSNFTPPLASLRGKPHVRIENVLVREKDRPAPLHVWTITQVRPPASIELDVEAPNREGRAYVPLMGTRAQLDAVMRPIDGGDDLRWHYQKGVGGKIGTFGRAIAAVYDDGLSFGQRGGFLAHGPYADGSNVQTYVSDDYVELELLSPTVGLRGGEVYSQEVLWYLQ
jgi:hypothetical protein